MAHVLRFGDLAPGELFTMVWDPDNTEWAPGIWRKTMLDISATIYTATNALASAQAAISADALVTRWIRKAA